MTVNKITKNDKNATQPLYPKRHDKQKPRVSTRPFSVPSPPPFYKKPFNKLILIKNFLNLRMGPARPRRENRKMTVTGESVCNNSARFLKQPSFQAAPPKPATMPVSPKTLMFLSQHPWTTQEVSHH